MISMRDRDQTAFPTMNGKTVLVVTVSGVKNNSTTPIRIPHNRDRLNVFSCVKADIKESKFPWMLPREDPQES